MNLTPIADGLWVGLAIAVCAGLFFLGILSCTQAVKEEIAFKKSCRALGGITIRAQGSWICVDKLRIIREQP